MPDTLSYLHDVAAAVGEFGQVTTTSIGTALSLISTEFANLNLAATSAERMSVLLEDGAYAGESRFAQSNGLNKSTGALAIADTFTGVVASGVTASLYSRMSAMPRMFGSSFLQQINQALWRLWFERILTLDGTSNLKHVPIDTTAYPWLTDETRIIGVFGPVNDADDEPAMVPRGTWEWRQSGETRSLYFRGGCPANTGQTFTVRLYAPGNSRLKKTATGYPVLSAATVGSVVITNPGYYLVAPTVTFSGGGGTGAAGTAVLSGTGVASVTVTNAGSGYTSVPSVRFSAGAWADQTAQDAGLASIFDEAIPDIRDVTVVGQALIYEALATMQGQGNATAAWQSKASIAAAEARGRPHFFKPSNRLTGIPNLRNTRIWAGDAGSWLV